MPLGRAAKGLPLTPFLLMFPFFEAPSRPCLLYLKKKKYFCVSSIGLKPDLDEFFADRTRC